MKYKLQDLIDINQFQVLQEKLNAIYKLTTAILDIDGNILTAKGWQDACVKFHRVCHESEKGCKLSDQYILNHLSEANPAVTYKCLNGLYDCAFPIIIEGVHYGNFFIGQYFLEAPDLDFFRTQAEKYGFETDGYMQAIADIPVYSEEQLNSNILFIKELLEVITSSGLKNLKNIEAQEALAKTQALYHDLVETAQDLIWQCDAEGRYIYLNPAWEEVFGYSVEEMLGKKFVDFQSSDWAERDLVAFSKLLKGNTIKGLETVHLSKQGKEINLVFNAKFIRDKDGVIIGTRGTAFNSTNFRTVEKALIESEQKFSKLFNAMNEGVVLHKLLFDEKGVAIDYEILEANPAFEVHTGIIADIAMNQAASIFYNTKPAPYLDIYSKVAIGGDPTHFETYFPPLEKYFNISVFSPMKNYFATIFTDITERKVSENALRISKEQLNGYINNSPMATIEWDSNFIITRWAGEAENIFGWNAAETIGKPIMDLNMIFEDDIPIVQKTMEKLTDNSSPNVVSSNRNYTKNRNVINCEWFNTSLFNENGEMISIMSQVIDITERKKTEKLIQNQLEELKRFNATMVEREIKMIALKNEINEYCEQLNLPYKYSIPKI